MNVRAAVIAPSRSTPAATGTARSARPTRATAGLRRAAATCSPPATSTWSSPCRIRWRPWPCRTSARSRTSCFAPAPPRCGRSLVIRVTWARRPDSSASCTPGINNCSFTRTCIAWFPPVACLSITPAGSARRRVSSCPSKYSAGCSAENSSPVSANSIATADWFSREPRPLFRFDWVVYSKRPFGGAEHVLHYLGAYTHRVAISNHRLVALADGYVTFRWRDSAHKNKLRLARLPVAEFLRRFFLHVLPPGFVRIRYFGFLAHRRRATLLPRCLELLAVSSRPMAAEPPPGRSEGAPPLWKCPLCQGPMILLERLSPVEARLRSPPQAILPC